MSLYAWLMLLSFVGPLALSFDKKVAFYRLWPSLLAGILLNLVLFVLWDSWFTKTGIWSFNGRYVWPYRLLQLPIEEWSFFVVVPYASIFIYACLKVYFKAEWWQNKVLFFNLVFMLFCLFGILFFSDRTYTLVNFSLAFVLLALQTFIIKGKYMPWFWFAYFVHLIPFLLVNGILTGATTPEPVVIYNPTEIIGWRIISIPVEDTLYALTCLLLPISIMELLLDRKNN